MTSCLSWHFVPDSPPPPTPTPVARQSELKKAAKKKEAAAKKAAYKTGDAAPAGIGQGSGAKKGGGKPAAAAGGGKPAAAAATGDGKTVLWCTAPGAPSRRRTCHFADTPSPSLLKRPINVEGVPAE